MPASISPSPGNRQQAFSEFMTDLTQPNKLLLDRHAQAPLIEKNPVLFWQGLSFLLGLSLVLTWIFK